MLSNLTEHGAAFLYFCCVSYYQNNLKYSKDVCSVSSEMIGYKCQVNHMKPNQLWTSSCWPSYLVFLNVLAYAVVLTIANFTCLLCFFFFFPSSPKTQACRELSQHRYQQVNEKLPMRHCWDFIDLILYAYFFHLNIIQEKSR